MKQTDNFQFLKLRNRELWRYSMEFISKEKIVELSNPGVVSRQLLNPENSSSERVTITEVHLEIGACQPRHTHDMSLRMLRVFEKFW